MTLDQLVTQHQNCLKDLRTAKDSFDYAELMLLKCLVQEHKWECLTIDFSNLPKPVQ